GGLECCDPARHTQPGDDRPRLVAHRSLAGGFVGRAASLAGARWAWRGTRGVEPRGRVRPDRPRLRTVQYHSRFATWNARRQAHHLPPRESEAVVVWCVQPFPGGGHQRERNRPGGSGEAWGEREGT